MRNTPVFTKTVAMTEALTATLSISDTDDGLFGSGDENFLVSVINTHATAKITDLFFSNTLAVTEYTTETVGEGEEAVEVTTAAEVLYPVTVAKLSGLSLGVPATDAAAGVVNAFVVKGWLLGKSAQLLITKDSADVLDVHVDVRRV